MSAIQPRRTAAKVRIALHGARILVPSVLAEVLQRRISAIIRPGARPPVRLEYGDHETRGLATGLVETQGV